MYSCILMCEGNSDSMKDCFVSKRVASADTRVTSDTGAGAETESRQSPAQCPGHGIW